MSRRPLTLGLAWWLWSCGSGEPRLAARVEEHILSADRLAEILVLAQPLALNQETAYELASHWVTLTAFGRFMAEGDSLLDSTRIADLMEGRTRQLLAQRWRDHLERQAGGGEAAKRLEADYPARLLGAKRARLAPTATGKARRIAANPWATSSPAETLAAFTGGALTARELARHVQYLSPATRAEMVHAPEARIEQFLWGMVLEELLRRQADSAGLGLSASDYQDLARGARAVIHELWHRTGLAPSRLAAEGRSVRERRLAAARHVEAYFDAAAARRVAFEPVPPFVAVALLREVRWDIAPEGLEAALERARRLLAAGTRDASDAKRGPPPR